MPPKKSSKPIDIPQDEQWRLINESGVLKKVDSPSDPQLPLGEGTALSFLVPHATPRVDLYTRNIQCAPSNYPMLFSPPLNANVCIISFLGTVVDTQITRQLDLPAIWTRPQPENPLGKNDFGSSKYVDALFVTKFYSKLSQFSLFSCSTVSEA